MVLEKIEHENDIKRINKNELPILAEEIRSFLIDKISKTGGHLASNLGVVELTMALHLAFDLPEDKIIWDVGHQSYTHKLLTGRKAGFDELRKYGGMSGFPKRHESDCDCFDTGHSSTSISAGLGYAMAREITGEKYKVISVIGDGALTGGMAYEALNNASKLKSNLIIVLNDNKMSISENVGGVSRYLSGLRTAESYQGLKNGITNSLNSIPKYGERIVEKIRKTKNGIKQLVIPGMLFENMGILYLGPVDGHNIPAMVKLFKEASKVEGPVLVHVITEKGKGYLPAERHPARFHGTEAFDVETGLPLVKRVKANYTDIFSTVMRKLGDRDEKVVAITAAMADGTGLKRFRNMFPERFFDVGIAEEHAVTFAAGLAAAGLKPIVAVYSSFLQRAYDQIEQEMCINQIPATMIVTHASVFGHHNDTHIGILDIPLLANIPNLTYLAPVNKEEYLAMLDWSIDQKEKPVAIRVPWTGVKHSDYDVAEEYDKVSYMVMQKGQDVCILALGGFYELGVKTAALIKETKNIQPTIINPRFITGLDENRLDWVLENHKIVVTIEDGILSGGFGSKIAQYYSDKDIKVYNFGFSMDIPRTYEPAELMAENSLTEEKIVEKIFHR